MKRIEISAVIVACSVFLGSFVAFYNFQEGEPEISVEGLEEQPVHEHALFHIVRNGSELDLWRERFQLNSRRVHLENNISDIVHRHAPGVTWSDFLETINVSFWRSNSTGNLCLKVFDSTRCGKGRVVLKGEEIQNTDGMERVIRQGDHLLIMQETEGMDSLIREYMKQQLPPGYKPQRIRGRSV